MSSGSGCAGGLTRAIQPADTLRLKGAAILSIVLHNYFHFVGPVRENEFDFAATRFHVFLSAVQDPRESVQAVFSLFGHYGVQVFIFLSAYGLAARYWNAPAGVGFVWARVRKLYPMFFAAIIGWALLFGIPAGPLGPLNLVLGEAANLILTLAGISSLIPGYGLPPVGPWWFVPFIIQWYCFWPAVRRFTVRFGPRGLWALSALSLVVTHAGNAVLGRWAINLLETPIGHMPELCLGIAAARYGLRIDGWTALLAGAVLIGGNIYAPLWPLSFVAALAVMLWLYARFGAPRLAALVHVGSCSVALFLFNGVVRAPFVVSAVGHPWYVVLTLGVASTALSLTVAGLLPHSRAAVK